MQTQAYEQGQVFLGSMSSKNQKNSRKTKENQKNLEKTKKQKTKDFAGFGRLLWLFGFLEVFLFSLVFLEFFLFF